MADNYEYNILVPNVTTVQELRKFLNDQGKNGWILASLQTGHSEKGINYLTVFYRRLE